MQRVVVTVTLNLGPEVEAGLLAHAQSAGVTPEEYLRQLVERDLAIQPADSENPEGSGMLWEDGLLIYGAGSTLPASLMMRSDAPAKQDRIIFLAVVLEAVFR
jgi:hypothetical protein